MTQVACSVFVQKACLFMTQVMTQVAIVCNLLMNLLMSLPDTFMTQACLSPDTN